MSDAAVGVVGHGAAKLLLGDFFMGDGLDDVGAGDEHVGSFAGHEDEIGDGGGIHRAARARPHDGADLRDHAAGQRVAQENIGVTGERGHAFLDARAAGIVQADDRRAGAHGQIHDFADFQRVGFRERAAENGEVLRENINQAAVDAAESGDKAVARRALLLHAKIDAAVADKFVELFEGAFIEQQMDALARGQLAGFVLAFAALRAAAGFGFRSRRRSSSMRSWCLRPAGELAFFSGKGSSRGRRCLFAKNADGEMSGKPDGAEKQNDAEEQFRADGDGPLERRSDGGHIDRGAHQHEHRAEGHRHDQNGGQNGGENHFHGSGIRGASCASAEGRIAQANPNQNGRRPRSSIREFSANRTSRRQPGSSRWDLPGRT